MRCFLALLLMASLGAAPRPITHEDVWLMTRVGAPVVSPDGKHVVVNVTEPAYDAKDQTSDLWIVPADGSAPPRRLTFSKAAESAPAFSPDSRSIAFTAKREGDEEAQIYVLSLDGGEALRYTSLSTGASSPKWSPDGKMLLFESDVYPAARTDEDNKKIIEERKKRKWNARIYESFPIRSWDRWEPETQPHLFVMEAKPGAHPKDLLAGTRLVSQPGFGGAGTGTGGQSLQPVWAPDSQSIIFTASVNRHVAAYDFPDLHLYQVPVAGGEPQALTSGDDSYAHAQFSPDGKSLYATLSLDNNKQLYTNDLLVRWNWPLTSPPQPLTKSLDRSVGEYVISADSRTIYFVAEEHGHDKIFVVSSSGGDARLAFPVSSGGYSGLSLAQKSPTPVLVASFSAMTSPPEVVRVDPAAGKHAPLTRFNEQRCAAIDWQPPRHFWFTSKQGKQIHNLLVLPPAFDETKKYPLLVFMHGGPHNMWKDQFFLRWNYHLLAAQGFVVLMTNYSGSTGFGEKFADSINQDVLRLPASEINQAADEAIRRFPFIDASRQVAGGASYGGYLANWMLATTNRYKVLFNHAGLTDHRSMWGVTDGAYFWEKRYSGPVWEERGQWKDQNPFHYAANYKTPMFISHGERDFRVPLGQGLMIYKLLKRQKVPAKLVIFPEENHWILNGHNARFFFDELFAFLKRYVDLSPHPR